MGMETNKHLNTVRRAALPEVLFTPDIAFALDIPEYKAAAAVREGSFGPHFLVDAQPAVLRKDFIDALSRRSHGTDGCKEVLL
jgi:hypothetical protein